MKDRIKQLDSVRGLASLSVLLNHMYLATPIIPIVLWQSPFRILINGRGAVLLFFVLSGFVLSIPYFNGKQPTFFIYVVKRIFRIYIPYLFAISAAIIACALFASESTFTEGWVSDFWNVKPDLASVIDHLSLIGNIHTDYFNTVIWSLVHEMRISLLFPFILMVVGRLTFGLNLIICILLTIVAGLNDLLLLQPSYGFHTSYFDTLHYLSMFIMGALLYKHKLEIANLYKQLSMRMKWIILGCALLLYSYSAAIDRFFNFAYNNKIADYGITLAALTFVIFAIHSTTLSKLLLHKKILFLGKISYSLYLYHLTVLLSAMFVLDGLIPVWLIQLIVFVLAIVLAYVTWYLIENNAIKLGYFLTRNRSSNAHHSNQIANHKIQGDLQ